ncbi:hypothetical protein TrLO_g3762 [Triparma laevis f. longispina]|uniref:Uncharacterized protein n=1 Tax=Triparma laevis f. longispina TaxID=1714387 RepID=A0A9W7KYN3_9STRA|nr:hypothetical protein TrLO_g3762 [Triparma laevis f. longispina]
MITARADKLVVRGKRETRGRRTGRGFWRPCLRVGSGTIIVHSREDHSWPEFDEEGGDYEWLNALEERRKLVMRVIFFLDITKVRDGACSWAINLIVIDTPEGVERIGGDECNSCRSLTAASFQTTLTSIGNCAFELCSSLENVDLLHTNLQELGQSAFALCSELKSMTIPDSLQTLSFWVFFRCSKLVASHIDELDNDAVVAHLRSQ